MSVAVLGTGSWGTTFAQVIADAGHDVVMWGRNSRVVNDIVQRHANPGYLPGLDLSPRITASTDLAAVVDGVEGIVLAVPAQSLDENLSAWPRLTAPVLSLMKGIERGTHRRMSEVLQQHLDREQIAVLSGPNLAREIAERQPCASVVAAHEQAVADRFAELSAAPYFRVYTSTDVVGVEIGGAGKNVIALACGIAAGVGLGDNTKATLITRGLSEVTRLAVALGADAATLSGLAGMGDLVATCASPLSRNARFGAALGRGLSVGQAQIEVGQTAEGVATAGAMLELAQEHGVEVPITAAVVEVIMGRATIDQVITALLSRPRRAE
ncbi:NAD(P)-dependent glycerol-3-phosphate dehydrogenase [Micrococcales bacterium 31B]|nr:NAD(P)-dependent glycerol-3-phosphate dehydrogenase [Micrococcales bacterium 31B]